MLGDSNKRFGTRAAMVAIASLLSAALVAGATSQLDSQNWSLTDWGNLLIAIILGLYFLFLAQHLNRDAERRATDLANAALITTTGLLAMSSARSVLGSESSALRVAADARAALQHYRGGEDQTREGLEESVVRAYNDLAFSTFLHADVLSRSVWDRLREGASSVVKEADRLASTEEGSSRAMHLRSLADHVAFVEQLGVALHKHAGLDLAVHPQLELPEVWKPVETLARGRAIPRRRSAVDETKYRLGRLETLYRTELTVMHDWKLLHKHAGHVLCSVELVDAENTGHWLAPWFVGRRTDGALGPVNVFGADLDERARYDKLTITKSTPLWPRALAHGELPEGMRTTGITSLTEVLIKQPSPTICVLAYDFIDHKGTEQRLVLDGNHRLAAARRLSTATTTNKEQHRRYRVLTFLIREKFPVDGLTKDEKAKDTSTWRGFTPDIGLIRGTWRPKTRR